MRIPEHIKNPINKCFYCGNSYVGFVCKNCSTSGIEYVIKCPICVSAMIANRLKNYKETMTPCVDISLYTSMIVNNVLCDNHKNCKVFNSLSSQ